MIFSDVSVPAVFVRRKNRFVAECRLGSESVEVHVKNTGRLRELLVPEAPVLLCPGKNSPRRTPYDLIAVRHRKLWINVDSQACNPVFAEWAESGNWLRGAAELRPETVYGDSRLDYGLMLDGVPAFCEVKGVTLVRDGTALFPDAPTERGTKHLRTLIRARTQGYAAAVCFMVMREDADRVTPNHEQDPAFARGLLEAAAAGVILTAARCRVTENECTAMEAIPVILTDEKREEWA